MPRTSEFDARVWMANIGAVEGVLIAGKKVWDSNAAGLITKPEDAFCLGVIGLVAGAVTGLIGTAWVQRRHKN